MITRRMEVARRVHGTPNGAEVFDCHYKVQDGETSAPRVADFTAADVIASAGGTPTPVTFGAVIVALQIYGRTALSSDPANDEEAVIVDDGSGDYAVRFRTIPPVGSGVPPVSYTLDDVKGAPGAPASADFDAVIAAFVAFGDSAAL